MENSNRQLAAILFTDIVGYTAMMQKNEQQALAVTRHYITVLKRSAEVFHGQILNDYGDGSLCSFPSATEAVKAAVQIQQHLQEEPKVPLRIGIHVGELFFEENKVMGDSVNVASRIQSLGQPNTILFSKEVFDKLKNQPEYISVSLGKFEFKHVDEPLEIFALANEGLIVPRKEQMSGKLKEIENKSARRRWIAAAGICILLVAGFFIYKNFSSASGFNGEKSIAVLPFENATKDSSQEYISDGITQDIINNISKISSIKKVIGWFSVRGFRQTKRSFNDIAKELGVAAILSGSIQKDAKKTRIVTELIEVSTNKRLWGDDFEYDNNEISSIQSKVSGEIAAALKADITPDEKSKIEKRPTDNPEAYNLYLRGRYFWNQRAEPSLRRAISYFDSAIALDPSYAKAYSGIADCYASLGYSFLAPKDAAPKARAAALKALQIDSSLAEPHASLGYIKLYYDWDFPGAEQEFKKAISLNPNYDVAYDWYGLYLTATGRNEDAHKIIEKAQQIDPLSAVISTDMGFNLYYGKNFDKAIQSLKSTIELNPRFMPAHLWLGRTYQAMKRYDEALKEYQVAQTIAPNWVPIVAGMGNIYGITGQRAEAEKILSSLDQMSSQKYVTPYGIALVYTGLGETDKAFEYLQKAYDDRSNWLIWLNLDPRWDSVRSDKRFVALVRKVGLPS